MSPSGEQRFDRRQLLFSAGAVALAVVVPRTGYVSARPFVTSEIGDLRKVLVLAATVAEQSDCGTWTHGMDPFWQDAVDDVVAQHAQMVQQLESAGTQVMRMEELLGSAINAAARQRGVRSPVNMARQSQALHGLSYVRDFAVMLPRGLVLCNVNDPARSQQQALFRFVAAYAPQLRDYPVVFDAAAAGLRAEGGDLQILDEQTLIIGVGNHTDSRIAAPLARATDMDVIAVNLRNADSSKWRVDQDPLRDFFLHLNTSVAQVDRNHVLALPWVFEAEHTSHAALKRSDRLVADFGTIAKYRAGSGERDGAVAGLKLVDYLHTRGVRMSYVIGADGDDLDGWLAATARTRVIFPLRERQAANMLATAPGALLAFAGAERTHSALRKNGVQVRLAAGCEMWRGYGGPNCLTLPLERA